MSAELLQAWVNDDVGLSRPVLSFEEDLANGFLLAELLHRHRILPKLEGFSDKQSVAAKMDNFRRLQPALVDLGVRFDSRLANAMMTKRAGVALNLVYQLKLAIDSARSAGAMPALACATGGAADAAAQLGGTRVRATRRAASESMQAAHFESMLKKSAQDPKELAEALVLSHYNSWMVESAARIEQVDSQEAAQKAAVSQQRRQLELSKMREGRRLMDDWQAEGYRKQRESVLRQKEREKEALRFELTRRDRKARSAALEAARAAADQAGGIDEFEVTLKRLGSGADDEADFSPADVSRMCLDSDAHLASLADAMPRATSMRGEVDSFMDRLRSRKQEEALSRKEREVRRRKVMLEQAQAQAALEEKRRQEALLTKLGRQCAEERAISERLWAAQQEAAVMRDNRQLRERQYEERRQADAADRIARERELGAAARTEYAIQLAMERARAEEAAAAAATAAKAERHAACRAMALQLADIAEAACEVRQSAQRLLPPKLMREWLTLFANGVGVKEDPLTAHGPPDEGAPPAADPEAEGQAIEPELAETEALLAAAELDDYLLARAEWQPEALASVPPAEGAAATELPPLAPAGGEQGCAITGRMVLQCLEAAAPPPKPPPEPLPGGVIKLAVLGKPFSSKSEQAQRLADQFGLKVIMPHALVHSAVAAAMAAPPPADGAAPEAETDPDSVPALGRRAAALLRKGGVVPDEVVAGLVVAAIREVDPVSYAGFVLDSYPASAAQAKLLEKKLTGYAPDEAAAAKPKKSKLAPPPADPPPAEVRPPPGLDLVLRLDVSDETARARALGRRLDPATGAVYHVELDPPPEEPGLQERLVPLGGGSAEAQLGPALAAYAESEAALSGWLVQLDVLLAVSAEQPFESVAAEVGDAVEALLERKAKMAAEAAARVKAAAEEAAARAEEQDAEPAAAAAAEAAAAEALADEAAESAVVEPEVELPFPPPLTAERASVVLEQWQGVEGDFVRACSQALRSLRELRHRTLQRSAGSRSELASVLAAPDHRQEVVAAAQDKFNAMPTALRHRDAGKEELHMVVQEMQEALWSLTDERRAAAEALMTALHADGWLAGHALRLVLELLTIADAETNRYVRTCAVLKLYASLRAGRPVEGTLPELAQAAVPEAVSLEIPAINFGGDAGSKNSKDDKGGKGAAKVGKDAKEAPKGGKGAPPSAAGATSTLTDALSQLVRSYSVPVVASPRPLANGADGPSREEALVAEWSAELSAAIEGERCKLVRRLGALCRYGCGVLGELRRQAERTQAELDGMLGAKMGKEAAAVAALAARMREAAEAGATLDHALILEGEALVVDESLLLVPPQPPPPPATHPVEADKFSAAQLETLGLRLRECGAGELMRATAMASLLEQTSAGAFDAAEPPLPAAWRPLGAPAYAKIAAAFASGDPPLVAWPAVVAALAPVARPSKEALAATLESAARAAGRFELLGEEAPLPAEASADEEAAADEEGAGGGVAEEHEAPHGEAEPPAAVALAPLSLSKEQFAAARLWFEDETEAAGGSPAVLKEVLWRLFGEPTNRLDLARLLLFFCDDAAKAFLVAGFLRRPEAGVDRRSLSKLELFAVLHRDAPPAAELGRISHTDSFSAPTIDRLWDELGLGEEERVAHAHMARHPLGRVMLDACKAYHSKDAYGTVAALHANAQNALKM